MAAAGCVFASGAAVRAQSANVDPVTGRAEPSAAPTANTAPSSDAATSAAPASTTQPTRLRWGHRMQGELRVTASVGYAIAIHYERSPPCDAVGSTFCHGRTPFTLDFAGGFGVLEWLEVEARFRLGVEQTQGLSITNGVGSALPMAAGVGVRAYGSESSRFKFGFGAAVLLDFTANQPLDVVARLDQGIHYDVARNFAFYVQVGETIQFLRNLYAGIDGGLGVQGRFP